LLLKLCALSPQVPILTFPTYKQPYIVAGNYVNAGFSAAALFFALAIGYKDEQDRKRVAWNGQAVAPEDAFRVLG
jgi:hypothetical protein